MATEQTSVYGGDGGNPYELYADDPSAIVTLLEVWCGWGSGNCSDRWVLKGIGLTWSDGSSSNIYNHPDKDSDMYQTFMFPQDGTATWSLRTGYRIDQLSFLTNRGVPWVTGGDGGVPSDEIATGHLIGFEGNAGWEIDSLSVRFKEIQ
ncbi:Mannose-binding lectin [Metarhizium album ARSEF 1941]|uniref:Mannose-binding lectin n=1 Tax=Metarhizium album (strain ARSEF 1941) TaxID=1081103 RepID=A0A0B2WRY3_METAS|nr:Mannose-binding lectin [Metarhizium album ARSEF 1941]KHN96404.1 Mannose-binding lectin [Metarhizium album ARSEF 1941]